MHILGLRISRHRPVSIAGLRIEIWTQKLLKPLNCDVQLSSHPVSHGGKSQSILCKDTDGKEPWLPFVSTRKERRWTIFPWINVLYVAKRKLTTERCPWEECIRWQLLYLTSCSATYLWVLGTIWKAFSSADGFPGKTYIDTSLRKL
jgi:hypothetical protein